MTPWAQDQRYLQYLEHECRAGERQGRPDHHGLVHSTDGHQLRGGVEDDLRHIAPSTAAAAAAFKARGRARGEVSFTYIQIQVKDPGVKNKKKHHRVRPHLHKNISNWFRCVLRCCAHNKGHIKTYHISFRTQGWRGFLRCSDFSCHVPVHTYTILIVFALSRHMCDDSVAAQNEP